MKIVFMGTPNFAVKSLERLYRDGHEIACVFTQEDKPRNRGMKPGVSPVKELAVSSGTAVHQPKTLKDPDVAAMIGDINCDLIVVVAYGKFLTKEIIDAPSLGSINIHGSVLPKYRGASPIQHAIINGEKETGVTSQFITEQMDAGDIIFTWKTPIGDDETSGDLFLRLSEMGAGLLSETIDALSRGTVVRIPQNHAEASYAPLLSRDMAAIDWNKSAYEIKCKVRGLNPWPVATMQPGADILKVFSVDTTDNKPDGVPGDIVSCGKSGFEVVCSDGTVIVKEVQPPGGKRMPAADYIRGRK